MELTYFPCSRINSNERPCCSKVAQWLTLSFQPESIGIRVWFILLTLSWHLFQYCIFVAMVENSACYIREAATEICSLNRGKCLGSEGMKSAVNRAAKLVLESLSTLPYLRFSRRLNWYEIYSGVGRASSSHPCLWLHQLGNNSPTSQPVRSSFHCVVDC